MQTYVVPGSLGGGDQQVRVLGLEQHSEGVTLALERPDPFASSLRSKSGSRTGE